MLSQKKRWDGNNNKLQLLATTRVNLNRKKKECFPEPSAVLIQERPPRCPASTAQTVASNTDFSRKDPELLREMWEFRPGTETLKRNLEHLVVTDAEEAVGGT